MSLSKYDIEAERVRAPGTSHSLMLELVGSNKRVLDVGCDTGYLGTELAAFGNRVSGIEIDPVTGAEAAKHLEHVAITDLDQADAYADFEPGSFDVVIFGDVLEHLRTPLVALRGARPLLAPGGSVIISTPNVAHGDIRLSLLRGDFRYTETGILDDTHTRFFTRASLEQFCTDAGFVLADIRRTQAPLFATETQVSEADFAPELVETLRRDPEATTYQFVVRAVPDDVTSFDAALAARADQLQLDLIAARAEGAGLSAHVSELGAALHQTQHELARVREEGELHAMTAKRLSDDLTIVTDQLAATRDELQALRNSRTMRAARVPRSAYGRLRRLSAGVRSAADETVESPHVPETFPTPPGAGEASRVE